MGDVKADYPEYLIWADVYSDEDTFAQRPECPNEHCFSLVMSLEGAQKLADEVRELRGCLEEIERKGHGDYHGRGYSLANIAERALHNEQT